MTDFLSELEGELRAAHPRRRVARRRAAAGRAARSAPAALLLVLVLGGALAFVLSVGGEKERPSAPATSPVAPPPTPPDAPRVAVLNGTTTPGLGRVVGDFLAGRARVETVGNAVRQDLPRTTVLYTPSGKSGARLIAVALGARLRPLDRDARSAAPGARIVVEVGRDIGGARTAPLVEVATGDRVGTVKVLERGGRYDIVSVRARYRQPGFTAFWLVERPGQPREARFLGFSPRREEPAIDAVFSAELAGRRLAISRETAIRPNRRPRSFVLYADL